MQSGGVIPAGSSRALRLDPFALPVRLSAGDAGADERVRLVELHRERVVLCRHVGGMPTAINLPVTAFLGVSVGMMTPDTVCAGAVRIALEHADPALSIPLFVAADGEDIVAEWQSWAQVLQLPLLIAELDGSIRQPFSYLGQVRVNAPAIRRRRHTAVKGRRPSILSRRRPGVLTPTPASYRGEREIIARN
ncbi:MAG: hypothetical protein QOD40_729 [Alphaproteobacteria bacterium]|nr:hypothetical protein [Alphaproteobacteria bacterium]